MGGDEPLLLAGEVLLDPLPRGAGVAGDELDRELAVAVLGGRLAEGGDEALPLGFAPPGSLGSPCWKSPPSTRWRSLGAFGCLCQGGYMSALGVPVGRAYSRMAIRASLSPAARKVKWLGPLKPSPPTWAVITVSPSRSMTSVTSRLT